MKTQTLFCLATVGLAFANPIHNLEERGAIIEVIRCVQQVVDDAVIEICGSGAGICNGLDDKLKGFTSCVTNAAAEVTNIADITQNPAQWLQSVDCSKELLGGVENQEESQSRLWAVQDLVNQVVKDSVVKGARCLPFKREYLV